MGLGLKELQGHGWQRMLHPDDRDRVLRAWHESVVDGTPYEQEERHRGVDGTYRWFLARGVPRRDAEGRIVRWYGTNTDIEDRKQAEEELRYVFPASFCVCRTKSDAGSLGICMILQAKTSSPWQPCLVTFVVPFPRASENHASSFPSVRHWRIGASVKSARFPPYCTHRCWMKLV